ncbi:MAG: DUF1684 domain-containing protein [Chloroflexota bacterium]|nr:DUF1684 domain-containing protein [Chloroflexota bacterium]
MHGDDYLQLADWRRRTALMYARWREEARLDREDATLRLRQARGDLFHDHPQSPLPADGRSRFRGLSYYGYDPAYRMRVRVLAADDPPAREAVSAPIQLPVSGDEPFSFRRIGRVRLDGPLIGETLSVFWMEGYAGGLFVPFRDATSGDETYAAGRYLLDTAKGADLGGDAASGELLLDFNLAYHPSCAYDPRWNCPLAPAENTLRQAVRAGERL